MVEQFAPLILVGIAIGQTRVESYVLYFVGETRAYYLELQVLGHGLPEAFEQLKGHVGGHVPGAQVNEAVQVSERRRLGATARLLGEHGGLVALVAGGCESAWSAEWV